MDVNHYISSGLFEIAPFEIKLEEIFGRAFGIKNTGVLELKETNIKGRATEIGMKI